MQTMTINSVRTRVGNNYRQEEPVNRKRTREDEPLNVTKRVKEPSAFRTVLYGHAAYSKEIEECSVPKNTTFTVYAPNGALLDKSVSDALANGENLMQEDIQFKKDPLWFFNRSLDVPEPKSLCTQYPITYSEGEKVPDFCMRKAERPTFNFSPMKPAKKTKVVFVTESIFLSELFEQHKGKEIHWAGCSFTRDDLSAAGYGYAATLKNDRLKKLYLPTPVSDEVKRNQRAERFGTAAK